MKTQPGFEREAHRDSMITVLIEYSPTERRVMVRGAFRYGDRLPEKLAPDNQRNAVNVWIGVDMGAGVGFRGLVPEEDCAHDDATAPREG